MTPEKIKALRKALGHDAEQFADLFKLEGLNRARSVYNWEKGRTKPTRANREKMEKLSKQFF